MDTYTHVAMYRLSTYIRVDMVAVNCEKYSLKSENSKFPVFSKYIYIYSIQEPLLRYILHYQLIGMHMPAYVCSPCKYTSVHIFPLNHDNKRKQNLGKHDK